MELLVSSAVGLMTAAGIYLILRQRSFPVILGMTLLSYAVNVFLFATGRLAIDAPPVLSDATRYTDPLPQALVLTAIVISFGMTAVMVTMALGGYLSVGHDRIDISPGDASPEPEPEPEAPSGPDAPSEVADNFPEPQTAGPTAGPHA